MSHERLRFTLNLARPSQKLLQGEVVSQALRSDDFLGTHYGIFAQFNGKTGSDKKRRYFDCESLKFTIQNYNGHFTIGIKEVYGIASKAEDPSLNINDFSTGNQYYIILALQGLNNDFSKSIEVSKRFYEGDMFQTEAINFPLDNKYSQLLEENQQTRNANCLMLDANYQYRDGEDILWKSGAEEKFRLVQDFNLDMMENENELDEVLRILSKGTDSDKLINSSKLEKEKRFFQLFSHAQVCKMKLADVHIK